MNKGSAKKRGIIGAIIGIIVLLGYYIMILQYGSGYEMPTGSERIITGLMMIPIGALYGFGFAFGWTYMKSMTSALLGVAAGASFITILFSRENTLLKVLFIYMLALSLGIGLAWIPGIFKGIASIRAES